MGFVCPSVEAGLMDVIIPGMSMALPGNGGGCLGGQGFFWVRISNPSSVTGCYCTLVYVCEQVRLCMTGCLFSLLTAFILASRPLRMSVAVSSLSLCLLCAVCAPLCVRTGSGETQCLGHSCLGGSWQRLLGAVAPQGSYLTSGPGSCKM